MVGVAISVDTTGWFEPDGLTDEDPDDVEWDEEDSEHFDFNESEPRFWEISEAWSTMDTFNEFPQGNTYELKEGDPYIALAEAEDGAMTTDISPWFSDINHSVHYENEGLKERSISATVYLIGEKLPDDEMLIVYVDSVYRRPDGSLYARRSEAGNAGIIDGFTETVSSEVKETTGDREKGFKSTFSVEFKQTDRMTALKMKCYDAADVLLAEEVLGIDPKDDKPSISVPRDTAYVLLEKSMVHRETNEPYIEREIVNPPFDGETMNVKLLVPLEDGIATTGWLSFKAH